MIVAFTAVVLSLTGGAIAATIGSSDIERNAVKSKHIANGKVKNKDLRDNTIKTGKVRNGTLLAEDFASGQLLKGEKGEKGDKGEPGEDGQDGAQGPGASWALVKGDGTVEASSGGVTVSHGAGSGWYYVTFPASTVGKAVLATGTWAPTGSDTGQPPQTPPNFQVDKCGGNTAQPGGIFCSVSNNVNTVFVQSDNDGTATEADYRFYIVIL